MAKPTRVRYSSVGVFVDDIDMDRVQTVGASTRYNDQELRELGTLNIIEVAEDLPTIDVILDTNEYGSNKTLATFANKGFGCRVFAVPTDTAAGSNKVKLEAGAVVINGVRIPVQAAEIEITQRGAYTISIKPDPNASPQYSLTVDAYDATNNPNPTPPAVPAGEVGIAQISATDDTLVVTQDMITDIRDFKTINITDFELAKADIYIPVIPSGSNTIERTCYLENVYITRIDMSYSVDGVATENYSAETDAKKWLFNDAKQVIVEQFRATNDQTTYTLAYTPTKLADGRYYLKIVKNGQEIDATVDPATKTVTFSPALVLGDQVKIRYCSNQGGLFHVQTDNMVPDSYEHPGGVRRAYVEVYLTEGGSDNKLGRVQSSRITANLTRQALQELGKMKPYDRPLNLPVEITASLEFTDSDLEVLARLAGKAYNPDTGVDPSVVELNVRDLLKDRGLLIEIYRLDDEKRAKLPANHPWLYPLKKIRIPYLIPTSENWEVRVENNATQTFEFRSYQLQITA